MTSVGSNRGKRQVGDVRALRHPATMGLVDLGVVTVGELVGRVRGKLARKGRDRVRRARVRRAPVLVWVFGVLCVATVGVLIAAVVAGV